MRSASREDDKALGDARASGDPGAGAGAAELFAVGDVCPGDCLSLGRGIGSLTRSRGADFPLSEIAHVFEGGDIVFGNLEGVISGLGERAGDLEAMEFRGVPGFASALRGAGFTLVSVANNHTFEYGADVFHDTVRLCEEAGLAVVGRAGSERVAQPVIRNVRGMSVGWLAYTWDAGRHRQEAREALAWTRDDSIADEVAELRSKVDFLIVSPHWGREYSPIPPESVVRQAHRLVDAGADLILGHHPHVLQGVEKRGRSLIAYSLGNFVFDMWQSRLRSSAILRVRIEDARVAAHEFVPVRMNRRFQPVVAGRRHAKRILEQIEHSSAIVADPARAHLTSDERVRETERKVKKWVSRTQVWRLLSSIPAVGPGFAIQKIRRRVRGGPA